MGAVSTAAGARPIVVVGDVGLDVVAVPSGPIRYGTDTPARVSMRRAGAGANTASRLGAAGVDVTLVARVGDDSAGRTARAELERAGVRCAWAVDRDLPTGLVIVLVDETGERTMLPSRGANAALQITDVTGVLDVLAALPGGMPHLHLSGYVLLDPGSRPAGLAALTEARRRGWTTSVDPQAAALVSDVGRADASTRDVMSRHVDQYIARMAESLGTRDEAAAMAAVSTVVGALALSRVMTDPKRSDAMLRAAREHLLAMPTATDARNAAD